MQEEILNKLKSLLQSDDPFAVRREFNSLKSQFKSLPTGQDHREQSTSPTPPATGDKAVDGKSESSANPEQPKDAPAVEKTKIPATDNENQKISEGAPVAHETPRREEAAKTLTKAASVVRADEASFENAKAGLDATNTEAEKDAAEQPATQEAVAEKHTSDTVPTDDPKSADATNTTKGNTDDIDPDTSGEVDKSDGTAANKEASRAPETKEPGSGQTPASKSDTSPKEAGGESGTGNHLAEFERLTKAFDQKLKKTKAEKEKIERKTIEAAKGLIEDIKELVKDEENIGKAFSGFNEIQGKWKALPKVSNDAYRDLNAEYNKYLEEFFYNINIYKELKELDLKHNLELKQAVLADQKKLSEEKDIRLLEVEVRLNQDRWNEIGPTFKEEWEKIKDEFWGVTRQIYARIHDYYQERREEQQRNLVKKTALMEETRALLDESPESTKAWHEKSDRIKELQKQWKMIGFVPKKESRVINKEFRKLCDTFFDRKRVFHADIKKVQDANRDAKEALLAQAEAVKDSEDWEATSKLLIGLQKDWKRVGPAFQRDENRLWKKFRATCNHFFDRRNKHRDGKGEREVENLAKKNALIGEIEKFDAKTAEDPRGALKEFQTQWRAIGHVPYRDKDALAKRYTKAVDDKYNQLNIDKKELKRIRFEEHVEGLKDNKQGNRLIRKEEDIVRNKITKYESEINQLENNMGFFADSAGADKYKKEIEEKIAKVRDKIGELEQQIKILRNAE